MICSSLALLAAILTHSSFTTDGVETSAARYRVAPVRMSAWLVFDDAHGSLVSFEAHVSQIETVSAEWIECDHDGKAIRRERPTDAERKELLTTAKSHKVRVLALASNVEGGQFSALGVEKMLASDAAMDSHIADLIAIVKHESLDGIDLDYELLMAKDREPFARFVTRLGQALHTRHLSLAIALHPKDSEPGTWDGTQAQDWTVIGKAADFVRLMTYDQHWETSEAGPVASPEWVQSVMTFGKSVIPSAKLEMGIPGYGYDWVGKQGNSLSWSDFQNLAKAKGKPVRDAASQELVLNYADHKVYMADGEAEKSKFSIAKHLGIHGTALWRLGTEDPALWPIFGKNR